MRGCECKECMAGNPAPVTATRRIRVAVGSRMLRELEESQRRVVDLELALEQARARPAHYIDLICDRCHRSTISVTSTAAIPDAASSALLERVAYEAGWRMGGGHVCPMCVKRDAAP